MGERSVILLRDQDGQVRVVENVCAHRGVQFCRERHGNRSEFVCPYHQWNYDLQGNLIGVPFRRGVKQDGKVNGGMPPDFKPEEHGLTKLAVACRNGVVFASFDHEVEPLEDYLGPDILHYFDRVFDGRELVIHGYSRQRIGQLEADAGEHQGSLSPRPAAHLVRHLRSVARRQPLGTEDGPAFRHAAMISTRGQGGKGSVTSGVSSFKEQMSLNDDRFLDIVPEPWWNGPTAVLMTLFPSVIIQQQVNSLSTRHIQPVGHDAFDFVWTHFGFAEDSPEMTRRRLRQANLFGPAGFVSADDGEVIEFSQAGFAQKPWHRSVAELGGKTAENTEHMVTETLIRGMYQYWKKGWPPSAARFPRAQLRTGGAGSALPG